MKNAMPNAIEIVAPIPIDKPNAIWTDFIDDVEFVLTIVDSQYNAPGSHQIVLSSYVFTNVFHG